MYPSSFGYKAWLKIFFSIDWKVWVQIMGVNKTGFQKQAMTVGSPPATWLHDQLICS